MKLTIFYYLFKIPCKQRFLYSKSFSVYIVVPVSGISRCRLVYVPRPAKQLKGFGASLINEIAIYGLEIKIVPNKPCFGTETGYHARNFVVQLIFFSKMLKKSKKIV